MAKSNSSSVNATAKPAARKRTVKPEAPALVLNHTEIIESGDAGQDALSALINELDASGDLVLEKAPAAAVPDDVIELAVAGAESTETMMASATPEGVIDGATPTGSASDIDTSKKIAMPRKRYTDKGERLKDKLGTGLGDYTVLTLADAGVSDEELQAKMDETLTIIKGLNKKAQNWAVKFIEYLAGKKSSMSEVTSRTLTVLSRDGFITTGNEGNMLKDLVAKPYSMGAARAMGGNNLAALLGLKVVVEDGKGRFIANPDSLLLAKAKSMMAAVATPAAPAAA